MFSIHGVGLGMVRYVSALTLTVTLAWACNTVPHNREMCSTMISVDNGEDLAAVREKAFANFKSTCRKMRDFNDASQCYDHITTPSRHIYPQEGFLNTPLERLEFSVQSTNNVFLDLRDTGNNLIVIELGSTSRIESVASMPAESKYVNLSDSTRFWVTYINGNVQVGAYGQEEPFMESNDSNMKVIKYVIFDSDAIAEWFVYMPCDAA
ncbi:uncharacterized protein LOC117292934 [Asterias rubens]|uniref:uncharacterized protein LOC117292934 n=1 Tax=Asterias rubens TaxID=7604 RepID=UPI0014556499|nr:uncharacterized protein LOC117292934 [Asterias rubens]